MTATIYVPADDPYRAACDNLQALADHLARLARERDEARADASRLRAINADLRRRLAESETREGCPNI